MEAAEATMDQLRTELEGANPTPMERLLAERAIFCWFTVNIYEMIFNESKDLTTRQAELHLRRIDSAHRRFLSAVATLAQDSQACPTSSPSEYREEPSQRRPRRSSTTLISVEHAFSRPIFPLSIPTRCRARRPWQDPSYFPPNDLIPMCRFAGHRSGPRTQVILRSRRDPINRDITKAGGGY